MNILDVENNSIGEELGLQAGDKILSINGTPVSDILDFRFLVCEEELEMEAMTRGERVVFEIEKDLDDDLGLTFDDIKIRYCGNDCPFCFVDQNPAGMRASMYFRDEDFRLSFLSGHYVTLTNLSKRDMDRIVRQQLSPLFVSVHATNREVRKFLFGIEHDDKLLPKLEFLTGNGIEIHTQVVLCPTVNDGEILKETISELADLMPNLSSISVVPVGLTKHRQGLQKLSPVTPAYAREYLEVIEGYGNGLRKQHGESFVYAGDEFYIMAGKAFPAAEYYDGFHQKENGVGLCRYMLDDFVEQQTRFPERLGKATKVTFVTATLASGMIENEIVAVLNKVKNLEVQLVVVENNFYGHSVHITGLLTGQDIYKKLSNMDVGDKVYLPGSCVRDGSVFLDDWTVAEMAEKLGCPVAPLDNDFSAVFDAALNI